MLVAHYALLHCRRLGSVHSLPPVCHLPFPARPAGEPIFSLSDYSSFYLHVSLRSGILASVGANHELPLQNWIHTRVQIAVVFLLQLSALVICRSVRGTRSEGLFLLCLLFTPLQALLYLEAAWASEFP